MRGPASGGALRRLAAPAAMLVLIGGHALGPVQAQSPEQSEHSNPTPSPERQAALESQLAQAPTAEASSAWMRRVWINPGFYSWHWRRQGELRNANPGFGLEVELTPQWRLTAGRFTNSDNALSNYMGVYYLPVQYQSFKLGVVAGAFNGYPKAWNGDWFPALIPVMVWEDRWLGLHVALVPEYQNRLYGAVSFQLKARF